MLDTCMPHYLIYNVQERLVKKDNNKKTTILIVVTI
jgi:hypothetical protein